MGLVLGPQEQACQQRAMMDTHGKGEETTQGGEWTASLRHFNVPGRGDGAPGAKRGRPPDTGLPLSREQIPSGARWAWSWAFL